MQTYTIDIILFILHSLTLEPPYADKMVGRQIQQTVVVRFKREPER